MKGKRIGIQKIVFDRIYYRVSDNVSGCVYGCVLDRVYRRVCDCVYRLTRKVIK